MLPRSNPRRVAGLSGGSLQRKERNIVQMLPPTPRAAEVKPEEADKLLWCRENRHTLVRGVAGYRLIGIFSDQVVCSHLKEVAFSTSCSKEFVISVQHTGGFSCLLWVPSLCYPTSFTLVVFVFILTKYSEIRRLLPHCSDRKQRQKAALIVYEAHLCIKKKLK